MLVLIAWRIVRGRDLLPLTIDARDGESPEGNQICSGDELGSERRQELPMPSQEADENERNRNIEDVFGGRERAFGEKGEDDDLQSVSGHRENHTGAEARAGGKRTQFIWHNCG